MLKCNNCHKEIEKFQINYITRVRDNRHISSTKMLCNQCAELVWKMVRAMQKTSDATNEMIKELKGDDCNANK